MGNNCVSLVADLFLFCYERGFIVSLSDAKHADVIDAFNTTPRYLDDILNINNVYFDNMLSQIYPSELQLNKANTSDTEAAFLDFHLSRTSDTLIGYLPIFQMLLKTFLCISYHWYSFE